jgi:hypothetical protein
MNATDSLSSYSLTLTDQKAFYLFLACFSSGVAVLAYDYQTMVVLPAIVICYTGILFFSLRRFFVSLGVETKNSPYFLGFLFTLSCLIRIFLYLPGSNFTGQADFFSFLVPQIGAALSTSIFGLIGRYMIISFDPIEEEQQELWRIATDELKKNSASYQKSQRQLIQLVEEFVSAHNEILEQEEKASRRHIAVLSETSATLEKISNEYPFAVKIATGKINALTGDQWNGNLCGNLQDYLVAPEQPWLDGYCVEKGFIRQFVAMPLGSGYSAEEQITGKSEFGGLQIIVFPMKREAFDRRFPKKEGERVLYQMSNSLQEDLMPCFDMGLAPGGRMRQEIYDDPYNFNEWDIGSSNRGFIHIANSLVWRAITDEMPPTIPLTASEYNRHGLPWFEYYNDDRALNASKTLTELKSIIQVANLKQDNPLPENKSISTDTVIKIESPLKKTQVREGIF